MEPAAGWGERLFADELQDLACQLRGSKHKLNCHLNRRFGSTLKTFIPVSGEGLCRSVLDICFR